MLINRVGCISLYNILAQTNNNKTISQIDNSQIISFKSIGPDGERMKKEFARFHCPCCGIKMLSPKDLKKITNFSNDTQAKDVLPNLTPYKKSLHHIEKEVFNTIEDLSNQYPTYTIRELLNTVRQENLDALYEKEKNIIERIRAVGSFASKASVDKLTRTLEEADLLLSDDNTNSIFKRRAFIGKIADAVMDIPEQSIGETIFNIAKELPRAGNDKNAFIVKYTEKKPSTGQERTSVDIITALFWPSVGTIEHVKAKSPNVQNGGGPNEMKNYLLECCRDNNMRGSMPFRNFVEQNPQFYGKHAQKYIDEIIFQLNHGNLQGFEKYPLLISRTLRRQSKGKISLDISKLDKKFYKEKACGKSSFIG